MRYIILATHGEFADGVMDSLGMIYGEMNQVIPFCAFVDPDENLSERVCEFLDAFMEEDEVVVLADLLGGSICNEFIRQLYRPNLHVIAGLNLAMVLEMITNMRTPLTVAVERTVASAKNSVVYCNGLIGGGDEKEEDL